MNVPECVTGIVMRSEQRDLFIVIKNIFCQYTKIYPRKIYFKDVWAIRRMRMKVLTVWRLAPKHLHCRLKIIEITTYLAVGMFNEGHLFILRIMSMLIIIIGKQSKSYRRRQR